MAFRVGLQSMVDGKSAGASDGEAQENDQIEEGAQRVLAEADADAESHGHAKGADGGGAASEKSEGDEEGAEGFIEHGADVEQGGSGQAHGVDERGEAGGGEGSAFMKDGEKAGNLLPTEGEGEEKSGGAKEKKAEVSVKRRDRSGVGDNCVGV